MSTPANLPPPDDELLLIEPDPPLTTAARRQRALEMAITIAVLVVLCVVCAWLLLKL